MNEFRSTNQLRKIVLRMGKAYSSFLYFTLEANENICFYSTLPFEKGQSFRDILVFCTPELSNDLDNILNHCRKSQEIETLEDCIVSDNS